MISRLEMLHVRLVARLRDRQVVDDARRLGAFAGMLVPPAHEIADIVVQSGCPKRCRA